MKLSALTLAAAGFAVLALTSAAMAGSAAAPVKKLKAAGFGSVLARSDRQALYYWQVEKKAGGKVRCTGTCAALWPPLIVRSRTAVPAHVTGIKGTFGVIRRPGGKLQVTYNRLPVYTYVHEGPGEVRCDNVNGWFVVRLSPHSPRRCPHGGSGRNRSSAGRARRERSEQEERAIGRPWVLPIGSRSRWRFHPPLPLAFRLGLAASPYNPRMRLRLTPAPCSVQAAT